MKGYNSVRISSLVSHFLQLLSLLNLVVYGPLLFLDNLLKYKQTKLELSMIVIKQVSFRWLEHWEDFDTKHFISRPTARPTTNRPSADFSIPPSLYFISLGYNNYWNILQKTLILNLLFGFFYLYQSLVFMLSLLLKKRHSSSYGLGITFDIYMCITQIFFVLVKHFLNWQECRLQLNSCKQLTSIPLVTSDKKLYFQWSDAKLYNHLWPWILLSFNHKAGSGGITSCCFRWEAVITLKFTFIVLHLAP